MSHSKGPWMVWGRHNSHVLIEAGSPPIGPAGSYENAQANARLIAAAPDLLELLEVLVSDLKALGLGDETASVNGAELIDLMNAQLGAIELNISKAKGVQS